MYVRYIFRVTIYFRIEIHHNFIFRTTRCHLLNLTLALSRKLEIVRFFAVDEFNALVTIDDLLFNNIRIMQLTFICRFLITITMLRTIGVSIRELNIDNKTILVTVPRAVTNTATAYNTRLNSVRTILAFNLVDPQREFYMRVICRERERERKSRVEEHDDVVK